MNRNNSIKLFFALLLGFVFAGCEKQKIGPLTDNRPEIPVTVTNAVYFRPEPTVTTPLTGTGAGIITINLSIPENSGRRITQITRVSASTSYSQVQGTTGLYNNAPIPGNGTTATFTTSFTEYYIKKPQSASNPAPALNVELANRFYFLLTLDDGSILIPEPVRVLVI
jgi:hypothetical protein